MRYNKPHEVAPEAFIRFLAGDASANEIDLIVRHLLSRCAACRLHLRSALAQPRSRQLDPSWTGRSNGNTVDGTYAETFTLAQRTVQRELDRQQRALSPLLAALDRMPAAERELKVRNERRFASAQLAFALVERSHECRHDDPDSMLHYARLATAAADRVTAAAAGGSAVAADCRARAWAQLGNAYRVKTEIADAEGAFDQALSLLEAGTGDRDLRARVLSQVASLRTYQRRFADATRFLEEVAALYRALNDRRGEAETLVVLAAVHGAARRHEASLKPLSRAYEMLTDRDADLRRIALFNLAWCYAELGRTAQARALLPAIELRFEDCKDRVNRLRLLWFKGVTERDIQELVPATHYLDSARLGFMVLDLPFESALVSLDLAECYLRAGNMAKAMEVIGEALPIFQGLGVEREFLAALAALHAFGARYDAAALLLRRVADTIKGGASQAAP